MIKTLTVFFVSAFLLSGPPTVPVVPAATTAQTLGETKEVTQARWEDLLGYSRTQDLVDDLEGVLLFLNEQRDVQYRRRIPRTSQKAGRD